MRRPQRKSTIDDGEMRGLIEVVGGWRRIAGAGSISVVGFGRCNSSRGHGAECRRWMIRSREKRRCSRAVAQGQCHPPSQRFALHRRWMESAISCGFFPVTSKNPSMVRRPSRGLSSNRRNITSSSGRERFLTSSRIDRHSTPHQSFSWYSPQTKTTIKSESSL